MAKIPTKPVFQDKEGCIRLAVFKNKNSNGQVYPLICINVVKFPFKYCRKIYVVPSEAEKLKTLLERLPEIEIKNKNPKKIKVKE